MLRTGSICISFLYNYLASEMKNNKDDDLTKKSTKLKCLASTFADSGGILSKLSQLIAYEHGDINNNVFSDCKPFNEKQTLDFITTEVITNPLFKNIIFDLNVYKSGSIAQVHKGIYNDKNIVIKIQYTGLLKQFKTDIAILNGIIYYLYNSSDLLGTAMTDIEDKLYEELDFNNEKNNQQIIYNIWKDSDICISEIIDEFCTDKVLTMYFLKGVSLPSFIKKSTQDERNIIGKQIVKFIFTNMYKHSIFYTDIHYGNFLIQNNNKLSVVDFGSIAKIENTLLKQLIYLHKTMYSDDKDTFYKIVTDIGILNENVSEKSKLYMYNYFKLQFLPWISKEEFHFSDEYVLTAMEKNIELMRQWTLPPNMVHFNKVPYGLVHILNKLNITANFNDLFTILLL